MCNELTKNNTKCKLEPDSNICNYHRKKRCTFELINNLAKENNEYRLLNEELSIVNKELLETIKEMKKNNDNYEFIIQFERIKKNLKEVVDIKKYYQFTNFLKDKENETLLMDIFQTSEPINFVKKFNKMRVRRNKLSHYV